MVTTQPEVKILDTVLETVTKGGVAIKHDVRLKVNEAEIEFTKSPFALKGEIKSMAGARWHGRDEVNPRKVWTVENCPRNWFQLKFLMGANPYEWFERELIQHEYRWFDLDGKSVQPRDHQKLLADTGLTYHYQIWGAEMGTGKMARMTTLVLTPTGWTTMGELKVGSRLIDPEGGECKVLSLHPQGRKEVFRVTFTDGSFTDCGAEHLWRVITPCRKWRGQDWQVFELQELVEKGLQYSNGDNKWFIPMVEPVQFDRRDLHCHPYVMGYLLGNAHFPQYKVSISDQETIDRLNSFMDEPLDPTTATERGEKIDYTIRCQRTRDAIDHYGLKECRANSKFVPEDFLFNTFEDRLLLLQGLMDSDGTPIHSAGIEFCSASDQLATAVVFLIQSMGGTCHRGLKEKPTYTYNGESRIGQDSHRIHGAFSDQIKPFLLSRKADRYTVPTKYQPTRAIVSVESVGEDECICIRVNSPSHCYVTDDCIVTHNTLAAQCVMEKSGAPTWIWAGPLKSLENIEREWDKWGLSLTRCKPNSGSDLADAVRTGEHNIYLTTYERLVKYMETRKKDDPIPQGLICDESSRLKSPTAQRSKAAKDLADLIRAEYGFDGFVILMSGTPSPKSPLDWWMQCEIAYPGFLKEGHVKALENRLAFMVKQQYADGAFNKRVGWKDDERKCDKCGLFKEDGPHKFDPDTCTDPHGFKPSVNEVGYMYDRLQGLVTIVHKKDVLDLPDKIYEADYCEPSPSIMRVARTLAKTAPNTITGITWLRELSDGFMYKDVPDGHTKCTTCATSEEPGKIPAWFDPKQPDQKIEQVGMLDPDYVDTLERKLIDCPRCKGTKQMPKMKRVSREVPCPKEEALKKRLSQCEETGRIVIFAGFQGSVDRIAGICRKEGWDIVQCDGRGWQVTDKKGKVFKTDKPLHYWADLETNQKVAFVAHPASGGLSLNLTEARMAVFWSNDFNPESRSQAEDRIHRLGSDENKGVIIVDLYHLPSDQRVRNILRENRKLELLTMGEVLGDIFDEEE